MEAQGFEPLTDPEWQVIHPLLELKTRRRKCPLRSVLDAIRYMSRTCCQWRSLPSHFPHWSAVYYYFRLWQGSGLWKRLNQSLVEGDRLRAGSSALPTRMLLDSQSVKLAPRIFEDRGTDGAKHVNGRKRHILTDSHGRILACAVTAANCHDSPSAARRFKLDLERMRPKEVLTDKGYRGTFARLAAELGVGHRLAQRPPSERGFVPEGGRWPVERTFAWMNFYRRLTLDHEHTTASHEAFIYIFNICIMLNRLTDS